MLRPVYIICCEQSLQDAATGLQSYMNIVEKLVIARNVPQPVPRAMSQMRIFTAWAAAREDVGRDYDFEVSITIPGVPEPFVAHSGILACKAEGIIRITTHVVGPPPITGPGIMRVLCRIRPVGSQESAIQEYPIILEELPAPANVAIAQPA